MPLSASKIAGTIVAAFSHKNQEKVSEPGLGDFFLAGIAVKILKIRIHYGFAHHKAPLF